MRARQSPVLALAGTALCAGGVLGQSTQGSAFQELPDRTGFDRRPLLTRTEGGRTAISGDGGRILATGVVEPTVHHTSSVLLQLGFGPALE